MRLNSWLNSLCARLKQRGRVSGRISRTVPADLGRIGEPLEDRTLLSPLTIDSDVLASGNITITAADTDTGPGAVDNITVDPMVTVETTGGSIEFNAGDNVVLDSTSSVLATGTITFNVDFGNSDAGNGGAITLLGTLTAPGGILISGEADGDSFTLSPDDDSPITVDGGDGIDSASIDLSGLMAPAYNLDENGTLTVTSSSHATLTVMNVEDFTFTGGMVSMLDITTSNSGGTFTVAQDGLGNLNVSEMSGGALFSANASAINGIQINGGTGDDTLILDWTNGSPVPSGGLTFNGGTNGAGGDDLQITGGTFNDATFGFTNNTDGTVDLTGEATITYTGLEPILSTITATNVTLNYSATAEIITVSNAGGGQTSVDSDAGEIVTFNNPTGLLTINAGDSAGDVINVDSLLASFPAAIVIDGEGGSDTININAAVSTNGRDITLISEVLASTGTLGAGAGNITITTDTAAIGADVSGTGSLVIEPSSSSTSIGLGGGAGTLNLDDAELAFLQDGFSSITIGDTAGGTGTVNIDTATFTDPVTIAGGTINDGAGTDIDAGANAVTLFGNVAPGQSPGILTVTGNFSFGAGATYEAEIMGAAPGTEHDQIDVTGTVDLNNATLNIDDTGFTAAGNDEIVLINNDGADAVTGTFNGLPEGANVTVDGQNFVIGYASGDGNDVVLYLPETEITLVGGTLTVVDANGGTSDDNLQVFLFGTDYQITENNGNIIDVSSIVGSTGSGTNMVTIPAAGVTGLDVQTLAGDDSLLWLDFVARDYSVGGVMIDGGTGDDNMRYTAGMATNLGNADLTVISTNEASVSGGGPITFVDGNLNILANASGTFAGVGNGASLSAVVNLTGTGDVMVTGRGGLMGGSGLTFGGQVSSTATGPNAGTITLDGRATGGADGSLGVQISNPSAFISSVDGDIMITGVGSSGTGRDNYGIEVDDIDRIESTGTGADAATITMNGTAGDGTFDNAGIRFANSNVTSALGEISLTGVGGTADPTSFASTGVTLALSTIQIDQGNLTIDGTSNGGIAAGLRLFEGEILSTGNGIVDITATSNSMGPDVKIESTDNVIGGASSSSNFTINANSHDWANLQIQSTGDLIIQPRTASTEINLGTGATDSGLQLDDSELGFLVDGFNSITIGDTAAGTGSVTIDPATFTDPITIAGGPISVEGVLNNTGGSTTLTARSPVTVNASITSTGDINITATDDDTDTSGNEDDVTIAAGVAVQSTGGNINVDAGDNYTQGDGAVLNANGSIIVNIDFGNADANGATATVSGNLISGGGASINGEADSDTFNIGTSAGSIGFLTSNVSINGNAHDAGTVDLTIKMDTNTLDSGDILNLNDQGDAGAFTYALDATTFARTGTGTITYMTIETLNLNTSIGFADVDVTSTADAANTTITTQDAADDIDVTSTGLDSNVIINTAGGIDDVNIVATGGDGPDGDALGSFTRVSAGDDGDTLTLQGSGVASRVELDGEGEADTVTVSGTGLLSVSDVIDAETVRLGNGSLGGLLGDICVTGSLPGGPGEGPGGPGPNPGGGLTIKSDTNSLLAGNALDLDDSLDAGSYTYLMNDTTFTRTGIGLITLGGFARVDLRTSLGAADVDVATTGSLVHTTITTQDAVDDIDVSTTGTDSSLVISTAGGADDVSIATTGGDGADGNVLGSFTQVNAGSGADTLTLQDSGAASRVELNGEAGVDTLNIWNTAVVSVTNVNGGANSDTINLGTPADSLGGILGDICVNGDAHDAGTVGLTIKSDTNTLDSGDILNLNDQGDAGAFTYALDATTFGRTGTGTVTYMTIETLNLNTSIGSADVDVTGTADGVNTTITTQDAVDDIDVTTTGLDSNVIINTAGGIDDVNIVTVGMDGGDGDSLGSFTQVNGGSTPDLLTLQDSGAGSRVELNDGLFVSVDATGPASVTNINNAVMVFLGNGSLGGLLGDICVTGSGGSGPGPGPGIDLTIKGDTNSVAAGSELILDDRLDAGSYTYSLTETSFTRTGIGNITIGNIAIVRLDTSIAAADVDVANTGQYVHTVITTQDAVDDVDVATTGLDSNLIINTASGADDVNIAGTGADGDADNLGSFTQVNAGDDGDTLTLQNSGTESRVELNSAAGNDLVTVTMTGNMSVTNITTDAGMDTIDINGDGTGSDICVDAGNDNDLVDATGTSEGVTVIGSGGNDVLIGGDGDDNLSGNGGSDDIDGAGGNDTLLGGGSSNDELTGGPGNDFMNGGAGTDLIRESADGDFDLDGTESNATLTGTVTGNDILIDVEKAWLEGGVSDNTIDASDFTGSVTLSGFDGKDSLHGGSITDILYGEDSMMGTGGLGDDGDLLRGNGGDDLIYGQDGDDSVDGGDGNDMIRGAAGRDTLNGDAGMDEIFGQGGSGDVLRGGSGDDILDGGAGNDIITETADTDFDLDGAGGTGTLDGGTATGTDTFVNIEFARLTGGSSGNMLDASGFDGFATLSGAAGNDRITASAGGSIVNGNEDHDSILGSNVADTISGGDGSDTVSGLDGHDAIDGDSGNDFLNGSTGNDTISGGDGDDYILGSRDADRNIVLTVVGADGMLGTADDRFIVGRGPDQIPGTADDILVDGRGADGILGTADDPSIVFELESSVFGLPGNDHVFAPAMPGPPPVPAELETDPGLVDSLDQDSLMGDAGVDTISAGLGRDFVDGGTESDLIDTSAGGREPDPGAVDPIPEPAGRDRIVVDPSLGLSQMEVDSINAIREFVDENNDGIDDNGPNMVPLFDQIFADGWDLLELP